LFAGDGGFLANSHIRINGHSVGVHLFLSWFGSVWFLLVNLRGYVYVFHYNNKKDFNFSDTPPPSGGYPNNP
jgi:hypothetical protein